MSNDVDKQHPAKRLRHAQGAADFDDVTPLPRPLSPLLPIQRRQAADFYRAPVDNRCSPAQQPPPAAEPFMVLSRREPSTLLAGLRTAHGLGLDADELAQLEATYSQPAERAQAVLRQSLLFEGLSEELLARHAPPERRRRANPGEPIAQTGAGRDELITLLSGAARVVPADDPSVEVARLGPGALLGEQSFVGTRCMPTRVEVVHAAELQVLDRAQAQALLADHPASLYAMIRVVEERVLDNMLRRTGFFRLFEPAERDEVCLRTEILEVAEDEVVVEQGTPSKTLCLLMSGTLELSHESGDGSTVELLLDPGGGFGMESLIDGRPAAFTARTTARSWIQLLRREDYLEIYERHPNLVRALKDVARRRRQVLAAVSNRELERAQARWPDFDPALRHARVKKVRKDRSHARRHSSGQLLRPPPEPEE